MQIRDENVSHGQHTFAKTAHGGITLSGCIQCWRVKSIVGYSRVQIDRGQPKECCSDTREAKQNVPPVPAARSPPAYRATAVVAVVLVTMVETAPMR